LATTLSVRQQASHICINTQYRMMRCETLTGVNSVCRAVFITFPIIRSSALPMKQADVFSGWFSGADLPLFIVLYRITALHLFLCSKRLKAHSISSSSPRGTASRKALGQEK
jgi:hypothetical protein